MYYTAAPTKVYSAYKEKYQANLDLMNAHVDAGMDPMVMAKKIEKIMKLEPSPIIWLLDPSGN